MRRISALIAGLAGVAGLVVATAALAIGNGVPDGNGHPNVGLLAVQIDGDRFPVCSGSYAGARKGAASTGVFLTAGHCVAWIPGSGIAASQLWVTFDTTATFDPVTFEVTGATTWYQAAAFAFDPAFGHDLGNLKDYAVVLLGTTVGVTPVILPTAGLLDEMAARRPQAGDGVRQRRLWSGPELQEGAPALRAAAGADVLDVTLPGAYAVLAEAPDELRRTWWERRELLRRLRIPEVHPRDEHGRRGHDRGRSCLPSGELQPAARCGGRARIPRPVPEPAIGR